ncbi:MAG: hypothetical protein AB7E72_14260 [Lysobacterales bacterium]
MLRGCLFLLVALCSLTPPALAGTALKAGVYLAELQTERLYRLEFDWDGAGTLTVGTPELIVTTNNGGGVHFAGDLVYVTGAGVVSRVDLRSRQVSSVQSFNNSNVCTRNPASTDLYCGWRQGLSRVPLQPFANGTLVPLSGGDTDLTLLAFTPGGEVYYSTGTEAFNGDFGRLNLGTQVTTRLQSGIFATGVAWDDYTQKLLVAGLGRARLIDPATPTVASSQRDDSGAGENYLSLTPTGRGLALGTRCCLNEARLVLVDYSASGDLASPQTLMRSVVIPGLSVLSGEAAFDSDRMFRSGFEDGQF